MIKLIIKEGRKIVESRLLISIVSNSKELDKILAYAEKIDYKNSRRML